MNRPHFVRPALLGLGLCLMTAPTLWGQGDVCSTATAITGEGTFVFNNVGADSSAFNGGGPCAAWIRSDMFFQWTAHASGDFQFNTFGTVFDTHMAVHAGEGCAATCIASNDNAGGGLQSEVLLTGVVAGESYLVQVGSFHLATGSGLLNISAIQGPCENFVPDAFEPNGTCSSASPMGPGTVGNLWVNQGDRDYFSYTLQPGETLTVEVDWDFPGDADLRLRAADCTILDQDGLMVSVQNLAPNPVQYFVEVLLDTNSSSSPCAEYTLSSSIDPDPCYGYTEDAYENNDFCHEALTLMDETLVDLAISKWDKDVYQICIPPQGSVTVDLLFLHEDGDIDMFLLPTWSYPCAIGTAGFYFEASQSINDNETITWTNNSAEPLACYVEVLVYAGSENSCNRYDLIVQGSGPCYIGEAYCEPAVPNSIGLPARIGAFGSFYAADEILELQAWFLPPDQFGYFLASKHQGFVLNPGGSMGNLCLSSTQPFARLNRPHQIAQVSGHQLSAVIDISDVPLPPTGSVAIAAGETWNFQCWYRDQVAGQPSSNLTHGLSITYR